MSLANDLAAALDPVVLAEQAGLIPDPWQSRFLRSSATRILLNCCRQSGKSTLTALLAVHTALYIEGALILMVSPSQRQSLELVKKGIAQYRSILSPSVKVKSESALKLEFENGSRIVSLPGKEETIRGYSDVSLVILDEASRVADELYYSIRPMLAVSQGRLIALSTPFGARGWWHSAWKSDEPWERYEVPARECPRISSEFLEAEKRSIGDFWFRQEYCCEFLAADSQAFMLDDIQGAFKEEVEQWVL